MKLHKNILPEYFTIADISNSWYTIPTNTFDFKNRNSRRLLVTVGDSWTWGSDISEHNLDDNLRVKCVYGNVLSRELNCDWLNLALSAQSNKWMADRISELSQILPQLEYDSIDIITVFTGAGRMFNTDQDRNFDYVDYFKQHPDFDSFFYMLNRNCFEQINSSIQDSRCTLHFAGNAVDPLGYNTDLLPWYRVLGFNTHNTCYTDMTAIDKLTSVPEFLQGGAVYDFKLWMLKQIDNATQRESIYNDTTVFRNCHPLADYHKHWADYLYREIFSNNYCR